MNHYIFLNSREDAKELLDHRSAIYSDQPQAPLTMVKEMYAEFERLSCYCFSYSLRCHRIGWRDTLPFQPYGDDWRQHRKIFHHFFHVNAVEAYHPMQLTVFRTMLLDLIEQPQDFMHLTKRYACHYSHVI